MAVEYFWDSYAVIEFLKGSPSYARFAGKPETITAFNLIEIYWYCLRELTVHEADFIFKQYREAVVQVDDETLKEAARFRLLHKKRHLSYADCIGYVHALNNNLRFLTGDKEFADLPNVEFVA